MSLKRQLLPADSYDDAGKGGIARANARKERALPRRRWDILLDAIHKEQAKAFAKRLRSPVFLSRYKEYSKETKRQWLAFQARKPLHSDAKTECVSFSKVAWLNLLRETFKVEPYTQMKLHMLLFSREGKCHTPITSAGMLDRLVQPLKVYFSLVQEIVPSQEVGTRPNSQLSILNETYCKTTDQIEFFNSLETADLILLLDPNNTGFFFVEQWVMRIWIMQKIAETNFGEIKASHYDERDCNNVPNQEIEFSMLPRTFSFNQQNKACAIKQGPLGVRHKHSNPGHESLGTVTELLQKKKVLEDALRSLYSQRSTRLGTLHNPNASQTKISSSPWIEILNLLQITFAHDYKNMENIRAIIWNTPLITERDFLVKLAPLCSFQALYLSQPKHRDQKRILHVRHMKVLLNVHMGGQELPEQTGKEIELLICGGEWFTLFQFFMAIMYHKL